MNYNISYEVASIPIFLILIVASISRKLTKGKTNTILLWIIVVSFIAVSVDFISQIINRRLPLDNNGILGVFVCNLIYIPSRHFCNLLYILFFYAATRTWYRIREWWKKLLLILPFAFLLSLYIGNIWLHNMYYVTAKEGYQRGPGVPLVVAPTAFYMVFGLILLFKRKKLLTKSEWWAVASIYILNIVGVLVQAVDETLVIESYFTAITVLFLALYVQKPEKQIDLNTGLSGYVAFKDTMRKIEMTGQKIQVVIACIENADELKKFMGDKPFVSYLHSIDRAVFDYAKKEKLTYELFFEEPGTFYLILDDIKFNPVQGIPEIRETVRKGSGSLYDTGMRVNLKTMIIKFPEEINTVKGVTQLSHSFVRFTSQKILYHAPQIAEQTNYKIEQDFDGIMDRAMKEGTLLIDYMPVWSAKEERIVFGEAAARIEDPDFGEIDEETLISAADARGLSTVLETYVLEQVFSYVGSGGMTKDGFTYITLKLSTMLGMQKSFTDRIWNLRGQYNVHPEQICFAVAETENEEFSAGLSENIKKLLLQGYRISLDGYGNGYLNIKHLSEYKISAVKLDKSIIEEVESDGGKAVLSGTIKMLQGIPLHVVAPGVDDEKTKEMLLEMGCEYMMGKLFKTEAKEEQIEKDNPGR